MGPLETPRHLLGKLKSDLARVRAHPSDTYAAFDFFVTAEHMVDWILPGLKNRDARKTFRESSPLLQAVSHIANGSKHFVAEASHHQHVQNVHSPAGGFASTAFDPHVFATDALRVVCDGPAAGALGSKMLVVDLAAKTFSFWNDHVERNC